MTDINQLAIEARQLSRKIRPSRKWQPVKRTEHVMPDGAQIWENHLYSVTVRNVATNPFSQIITEPAGIVLGISSHDGEPRHDWREFQLIKNEIAGPEWEAVELYPAESRLLDSSNYYMLWCFRSVPLGKHVGRQVAGPHNCIAPQRGWATGDEPDELRQK